MPQSARSFQLVDDKLAEADFFLEKLSADRDDWFAARCYVSAYIGAMRTVTYSMQAVLSGRKDFPKWYEARQRELRDDPVCRFFHDFRNLNQHVGDNLVSSFSSRPGERVLYWFQPTPDVKEVPSVDVESACREYALRIVTLVYACYLEFGPEIDAHQRYTREFFERIGKSIEDAEEELGFPRGWTDIGDPDALPYRWQALRDRVSGCAVNHVFEKYLGTTTPAPERLPKWSKPHAKGWSSLETGAQVHIPESLRKTGTGNPDKDIESYLRSLRAEPQG